MSVEVNLDKLKNRHKNNLVEDEKFNFVDVQLLPIGEGNLTIQNFVTPGGPLKRKLLNSQNYKNEKVINSSLYDEVILNDKYYQPCSQIKETDSYILLKVKSRENGEDFLMKFFKSANSTHYKNEFIALEILKECRYTLKMINSGKLLNKYEYVIFEDHNLIDINFNDCKSEIEIFFYFLQIFCALCELHYNGIIHTSLKLEDIMLEESTGQIYIFNFPNSVKPDQHMLNVSTMLRKDVYSLGLIILKFILNNTSIEKLREDEFNIPHTRILDFLTHPNCHRLVLTKKLTTFLYKILNFDQHHELKLIHLQEEEWITENKMKLKNFKADNLKVLLTIIKLNK